MKKSEKIILSAIMLSTINAVQVAAQSKSDTTHHHSSMHSSGGWFRNTFSRSGSNQGPTAHPAAVRPKTGGFGTTVRAAMQSTAAS